MGQSRLSAISILPIENQRLSKLKAERGRFYNSVTDVFTKMDICHLHLQVELQIYISLSFV